MKRLMLCCILMCLSLSACSEARQVENQAFVILLGLDGGDAEEIELSVQVPKIKGGDPASSEDSEYMIMQAAGQGFTDALEMLSIASPRRINLTEVKMIVVAEDLARKPAFRRRLSELSETYTLYGTSFFAVCEGKAKDFIERQVPLFSGGVSDSLTALLEHHSSLGYIPKCTIADMCYLTNSIYSDPIAIYAGESKEGLEAAPAAETPAQVKPEQAPADAEGGNIYAGVCLFRDGVMIGTLNAAEMAYINVLRGNLKELTCTFAGNAYHVLTSGRAKTEITEASGNTRIAYRQRFRIYPLSPADDISAFEAWFSEEISNVIKKAQRLSVEPFGFAEKNSGRFLTLEDWKAYGWRDRFPNAEVIVDLGMRVVSR